MTGVFLAAFILVGAADAGAAVVVQSPQTGCVAFSSGGRLTAGRSFGTAIGNGLEFRLSSNWTISVGPIGEPALDFLSIVSPPFRTAPHLMIGPGYGMTASESVGIERPLRFVLTRAEHDASRKAHETEPAATLLQTLGTLARGTLKLRITAYQIRRTLPDGTPTDSLESIMFEGEACGSERSER